MREGSNKRAADEDVQGGESRRGRGQTRTRADEDEGRRGRGQTRTRADEDDREGRRGRERPWTASSTADNNQAQHQDNTQGPPDENDHEEKSKSQSEWMS